MGSGPSPWRRINVVILASRFGCSRSPTKSMAKISIDLLPFWSSASQRDCGRDYPVTLPYRRADSLDPMSVGDPIRLGLFLAWRQRCAWCDGPLTFSEVEVDHVIPQSLDGPALAEVLALHGLPSSYNVQGLQNLVPACGRCNGKKGKRPPPATPVIALLLERAARLVGQIEQGAAELITKRKVDNAAAVLRQNALAAGVRIDKLDDFLVLLNNASFAIETAAPGTKAINVRPGTTFGLIDAQRWQVIGSLSDGVNVVRDNSGRSGYTGSDYSFACPWCGSHGPWSGTRCLTCGHTSDPAG